MMSGQFGLFCLLWLLIPMCNGQGQYFAMHSPRRTGLQAKKQMFDLRASRGLKVTQFAIQTTISAEIQVKIYYIANKHTFVGYENNVTVWELIHDESLTSVNKGDTILLAELNNPILFAKHDIIGIYFEINGTTFEYGPQNAWENYQIGDEYHEFMGLHLRVGICKDNLSSSEYILNQLWTGIILYDYDGVPTAFPSKAPTVVPTLFTSVPSIAPTKPTIVPTLFTNMPSISPTIPTTSPSNQPTTSPSNQPTSPSTQPTTSPSNQPTTSPSNQPTTSPSTQPTTSPSNNPTTPPSNIPTFEPTVEPIVHLTPSTLNHMNSASAYFTVDGWIFIMSVILIILCICACTILITLYNYKKKKLRMIENNLNADMGNMPKGSPHMNTVPTYSVSAVAQHNSSKPNFNQHILTLSTVPEINTPGAPNGPSLQEGRTMSKVVKNQQQLWNVTKAVGEKSAIELPSPVPNAGIVITQTSGDHYSDNSKDDIDDIYTQDTNYETPC